MFSRPAHSSISSRARQDIEHYAKRSNIEPRVHMIDCARSAERQNVSKIATRSPPHVCNRAGTPHVDAARWRGMPIAVHDPP